MRAFILVSLAVTVGVAMARPEPYGHGGGGVVQPGPAVEYTYPAVPPAAKCGHNLLISCNPHHTVIPCSHGHAGGGHGAGGAYHQEVPAASGHDDQYRHKKWHKKKHHKHHHGHHGHHYGHHRDASEMGEQMAMDEEMPMAMMQ
ncbi:vitelline membrane protein 15a-1-like [Culex quinquefasciatus]|uniref:vitelline membrane protein 15a-1-like n=1 Tax=Culex quinquefasciatus TaxID=7176 RepID=UPI0018E35E31|nr:vitelline membrane protein 15a-1-like [Culex quinquefasciatus]